MKMSYQNLIDEFVEEYVVANEYKDNRDSETLRENARKYSNSLRGTDDRLGWFEWLSNERGKAISEATVDDVRRFLSYLEKQGLSASTQTQARSGISLFYQHMTDCDNPVKELEGSWSVTTDKENETGEERKHPSREEIQAMIDNVPTPTLRSEIIIRLFYQTGVRRMELATMIADNVDIEKRKIRVYADKTDEWREVAFRPSLRQPLRIWKEGPRTEEPGYHDENPYLFPSPTTRGDNDHISGTKIADTVKEAAENAGIQQEYTTDVNGKSRHTVTPHALRHAFAVHSAEDGVPAPVLKEILGHHSLDITQIYADIANENAVDILKERGPSLE